MIFPGFETLTGHFHGSFAVSRFKSNNIPYKPKWEYQMPGEATVSLLPYKLQTIQNLKRFATIQK